MSTKAVVLHERPAEKNAVVVRECPLSAIGPS
jgi:hypothetical protein